MSLSVDVAKPVPPASKLPDPLQIVSLGVRERIIAARELFGPQDAWFQSGEMSDSSRPELQVTYLGLYERQMIIRRTKPVTWIYPRHQPAFISFDRPFIFLFWTWTHSTGVKTDLDYMS